MGPVRAFVDRVGWIGYGIQKSFSQPTYYYYFYSLLIDIRPVTYAAIYAACTVAMVPGTVLTLASGVIFAEVFFLFLFFLLLLFYHYSLYRHYVVDFSW